MRHERVFTPVPYCASHSSSRPAGMPSPLASPDSQMSSSSTSSSTSASLCTAENRSCASQSRSAPQSLAVADFRDLGQFAGALVISVFRLDAVNLLLELADFRGFFFYAASAPFARLIFLQHRQFLFDLLAPLFECSVGFFQQSHGVRSPVFCMMRRSIVNLHGQGIDRFADSPCLIDQRRFGLVRGGKRSEMWIGKRGGCKESRALITHPWFALRSALQSAQNRDGCFEVGLADEYRLEPALQRLESGGKVVLRRRSGRGSLRPSPLFPLLFHIPSSLPSTFNTAPTPPSLSFPFLPRCLS